MAHAQQVDTDLNLIDAKIQEIWDAVSGRAAPADGKKLNHAAIRYAKNFELLITHFIPELFHLKIRDFTPPSEEMSILRNKFKHKTKPRFLKRHLTHNDLKRLRAMGLNDHHIDIILSGRSPLDVTVDHKVPLGFNGKNDDEKQDFSNLRIIPGYLNELLNYFQQYQIDALKMTQVLTIEFNDNSVVPYVPRGFRRKIYNDDTWRKSSQLFRCSFVSRATKHLVWNG